MANKNQKESYKVIETIVFSSLIILVIFLNSYGPIYIRMIPLLFILGILGSLCFGRAVITTVFGIITSMCVVYLKKKYGFFENVFISFCLGLNIVLGEVAGMLFKKTYYIMDKSTKKNRNKKITTYIITILFLFIVCPLLHGMINGNFLSYFKSKQKLEKYIKNEYIEEYSNFHIQDAEYKLQKNPNYIFKVKYQDRVYNFVIYKNSELSIIDGYKKTIIANNNKKISTEFLNFIKELKKDDLKIEFDEKVNNINLQYTLAYDNYKTFKELNYAIYIVETLDKLKNFNYIDNINKIDITIKDKITSQIQFETIIDVNEYRKLSEDQEKELFIEKSFSIEYIDK